MLTTEGSLTCSTPMALPSPTWPFQPLAWRCQPANLDVMAQGVANITTAQTTVTAAQRPLTGKAMMSALATRDGNIWTPTLTTTVRSIRPMPSTLQRMFWPRCRHLPRLHRQCVLEQPVYDESRATMIKSTVSSMQDWKTSLAKSGRGLHQRLLHLLGSGNMRTVLRSL
jgi:hypothetical protein